MRHALFDMFSDSCCLHPDNIALVDGHTRVSYRDLAAHVARTASWLEELGIVAQQRVMMLFGNSIEFVVLLFALRSLDAVPVPMNWRLTPSEAAKQVASVDSSVLVHSRSLSTLATDVQHVNRGITLIEFSVAEPFSSPLPQVGPTLPLERRPHQDNEGQGLALVLFTSGSTGTAKAVAYTDASLVMKVLAFQNGEHPYKEDDSFLLFNPLFHQGGLSFLLFLIMAGAKVVLQKTLSATHVAKLIEQEDVTQMLLLPPSLCSEIRSRCKEKTAFPRVRCVTLAGGKNTTRSIHDIFELFPNALCRIGYGQTEGIVGMSIHFDTTRFETDPTVAQCIGHPEPLNFIKLLDSQGRPVENGGVGEAWGWSPAMFDGYIGQNDEGKRGWFPTGDLMRKRPDGEFVFVGRTHDMIKTGGENVYAQEVEQVLELHPRIKEAAVVGSNDEKLGETIAAALLVDMSAPPSPEELIAFFKEHAASYKKPRELLLVSKLPRTSSGKIDKRTIEQWFSDTSNQKIWRLS